eukprot:scaffold82597_cov32-Prasinocladus_malaysianus.AAC.2
MLALHMMSNKEIEFLSRYRARKRRVERGIRTGNSPGKVVGRGVREGDERLQPPGADERQPDVLPGGQARADAGGRRGAVGPAGGQQTGHAAPDGSRPQARGRSHTVDQQRQAAQGSHGGRGGLNIEMFF